MKIFQGRKGLRVLMEEIWELANTKQNILPGHTGQMFGFDDKGRVIVVDIADNAVTTFNGRKGVVTPKTGDYTPQMVGADPAGSAAAVEQSLTEAMDQLRSSLVQTINDVLNPHVNNKNNPHGVTKAQVGLGNVPNVTTNNQVPTWVSATSLANIASGETLTTSMGKIQKAIADLISHLSNTSNPHSVTKSQVGLGNVPNVSTNNQTPTYSQAATLANLTSGETLSTSMGKIMKAIATTVDLNTNALLYGPNGTAGKFDKLTTAPTASNPLRYNGNFRATKVFGVYFSDNADVAEKYEIEGRVEPGDIIEIDPTTGKLRKNSSASNIHVIGVVSKDPGYVLGDSDTGIPIALCGRVPVKCAGPVRPGDFLTSSEIPGVAIVTHPNVAPKGSIIGIALEEKVSTETSMVNTFITRM